MAVANELFCNFITWSLDGLLLLKHYQEHFSSQLSDQAQSRKRGPLEGEF